MAKLLDDSPLFRRAVVSVVKEPSNDSVPNKMVRCHRFPAAEASLCRDKTAASALDRALKGLYPGSQMSPDSQLGQTSPDSQLELIPQVPGHRHVGGVERSGVERSGVECGGVERGAHMHSTHVSDKVVGTDSASANDMPPTFPDTSHKPHDTLLYGYYLPHGNQMVGHRGHALSSRFIWHRRFKGMTPQPLEGVAIWTLPGGRNVVRVVVRDFFTGKYTVCDRFPAKSVLSDDNLSTK